MKAIIFGANGQDGYYLAELLRSEKIDVIGVGRSHPATVTGNVGDYLFVENQIKIHQPDYIFHLAANSTTKHEALFENHEAISTGSLNILESVFKHNKCSKVFLSGSGLQFMNAGRPISEKEPFEARDPYSISRIQSVYAGRYFRSLGIRVYVGYFFHHDSPRRSERHINMRIAKAMRRISEGSTENIEIGNIEVIKEFNYAGDFMKAIWLLVNQDQYFESVIGSGQGYSIKDWISICSQRVGIDWNRYVHTNVLFKPEFTSLISDPSILYSLGWAPQVTIEELAAMMIEA